MMKNKLAKASEKFILAVAKSSCGSASMWGFHQPKVPESMLKKVNKEK